MTPEQRQMITCTNCNAEVLDGPSDFPGFCSGLCFDFWARQGTYAAPNAPPFPEFDIEKSIALVSALTPKPMSEGEVMRLINLAYQHGQAEGRKQGVAEERARGDKLADGVMDQVERAYHCRSTIGGGIVYERAVETIEELVIAYRGEHMPKAGGT